MRQGWEEVLLQSEVVYDDEPRYDYADDGTMSQESFSLSNGSRVSHPTYGKGTVEQIVDEFGMLKAVVRFDEFGLRKVIGKHLIP